MMGYIRIPKIGVELPIFHGTKGMTMETAVGHMEQSSLPVGGPGSHCMLAGHRGLMSVMIFTHLDELQEGDTFTLRVLNETMTYEVDQIRAVLPNDVSSLIIVPGQDLCTLITCTPYGINTHRLLVRGHRVGTVIDPMSYYVNGAFPADAVQIKPLHVAPFIGVPIVIILLVLGEIRRRVRRSKG
jgi:sortase A